MIPTIIRVSKESWYLVWTALLRDAKREASTVNFPALDDVIITGDQKVASSPSWPACFVLGKWSEGMLGSLKCLCCPTDHKQQLPQFSRNCTDFAPCRATSLKDVHSLSPVFPHPPLWAPGRPASVRHSHDGSLRVSAPKAMMSAAPPMTSAKALMRSAEDLAVSVENPMPEHTSALLAAEEESTAADMGEGLPQQARRAWHKQQHGAFSVTGPDKGPDQDTALVLDRQHSPDSPLDAVEFLDSTLTPALLSGMPPSKSTSGVPSSDKLRGVPMAAAGLPAVPAPGSCTRLTSASTSAASCPSNFLETNDEEDSGHAEDAFRTAKSYDWLVDELLDMSVSSLLTSSPRHLSSQLSSQHQQATFGRVAGQEKLIGGR